jgi:3-hydroxy-9,10-secoandrosta-1,3,5(10)-triene-9,17-dione monooxygenase
VTGDEAIERARVLAAEVSERVPDIESRDALPDDVVAAFKRSGLQGTFAPAAHGGSELDLDTVSQVVRIFAAVCPSVAWNFAFYIGLNWTASKLSPAFQERYFANGATGLLAGSLIPTCKLRPVDGGYVVNGRVVWCSGVTHADYVLCAAPPPEGVSGTAGVVLTIPTDELTIQPGSWQVEAMRATGSFDVDVHDVFVPLDMTLPRELLNQPGGYNTTLYPNSPMYSRPVALMVIGYILPIFVGATRGAVDELVRTTRTRVHTLSGAVAAGKTGIQMRVGRAETRALLAESMLAAFVEDVIRSGSTAATETRRVFELRARAALIVDYCRETIADVTMSAGANAFRKQSKLQMIFRDVSMLSSHAFFEMDTATETFGKIMLGMEPPSIL